MQALISNFSFLILRRCSCCSPAAKKRRPFRKIGRHGIKILQSTQQLNQERPSPPQVCLVIVTSVNLEEEQLCCYPLPFIPHSFPRTATSMVVETDLKFSQPPEFARRTWHSPSVVNAARSVRDMGYIRREIYEAFNAWNNVSKIHLIETSDPDADIQISFERGHHGDPYPFDRPEVLAHAFPPSDHNIAGDIHFDDDESWAIDSSNNYSREISVRSVAMHEVGHSLGIGHSNEANSIMYPYYQATATLHDDDIHALQKLYGKLEFQNNICIYEFKGSWFWRVNLDGSLNDRPRAINMFWVDLPTPIDGALELNDRIYFFKGRIVYAYLGHQKVDVKNLTDLGISDSIDHIRLAYTWHYGNEERYYIWAEEDYWKLDLKTMKIEVDYPRTISSNWRRVPKNASAAFSWHKELYFFADYDAYKFGSLKMSVLQNYPKPFAQVFPYCLAKAEALLNSTDKSFMSSILSYSLCLFLFTNFFNL